jgi:hypothetical protein
MIAPLLAIQEIFICVKNDHARSVTNFEWRKYRLFILLLELVDCYYPCIINSNAVQSLVSDISNSFLNNDWWNNYTVYTTHDRERNNKTIWLN